MRRRTSLRIRCDLLAIEHRERFVEVVDRRDDLVTGVAEHVFIVERGQRLVLDDEDPLDDLLTLPEQHRYPDHDFAPATNEPSASSAAAHKRERRAVPRHATEREGGPQRIAKLLARAGIASRREIERMIAEGRIALNGEKLTTPATLLDDLERGHGRRQAGPARRGDAAVPLLQAAGDDHRRARSQGPPDDLRPAAARACRASMPVGRLDFMTEGLLLLTNDGELKRQLELPRTGVVRTYRARAFGARHPGRSSSVSPRASRSRASATARSTPTWSGGPAATAGSK